MLQQQTKNSAASSNHITLLAESMVRAARLEQLGAPDEVLCQAYALISKRKRLVNRRKSHDRLILALEMALMRTLNRSFSTSACVNCTELHNCQWVAETTRIDAMEAVSLVPFPFSQDALHLCKGYKPDWERFNETAQNYPRLVDKLESLFDIKVNRERLAGDFASAMGKWVKCLGGNY